MDYDDAHFRSRILLENILVQSSAAFQRDLLKEHRLIYNEAYPCDYDYEFWVRITKNTNLANLDDILKQSAIKSLHSHIFYLNDGIAYAVGHGKRGYGHG